MAVATAAESRRLEFRAGRDCARRALLELNYPIQPLRRRADRTVEWPEGVVGSVTHTRDYAAAVVARSCDWGGIGIDAELSDGANDPKLWRLIATPEEITWVAAQGERAAFSATLLFSAKEAFYKAQYCLTARWVNFDEARFHLTPGGFEIELLIDLPRVGKRGSRLSGSYCEDEARIVTFLALPARR
ncbi:MAG TPA: 4'-phosphopantetheinyl transferase superfamily protein [Candidatus Binataceae bacterium]|nr:4'-phosphopantetheinyl transferase superfamily protein [Candidatus Binataceae bacterium]